MRFVSFIGIAAAGLSFTAAQDSSLPLVDLGYQVHQALDFNETGQYYNFSNIRYAQAPVGNLRFAHPRYPVGRNPDIQNGSQGVVCPQASPVWQYIGLQFSQAFANGSLDQWNYTDAYNKAMATVMAVQQLPADPRTTEDCLFLDVFTPKSAFDGVRAAYSSGNYTMRRNGTAMSNSTSSGNSTTWTGAPVIVWIYGGGYVLGSKTSYGSPAGIMATAKGNNANSSEGVIFVAMNYRLGALGWLGGPSFQSQGGISNAALYDQRLAIQWVREKIHLFGGDPNRITLMGESAGGGSIMHQITAFGGSKGVNFQQAIPQSPGWLPISSAYVQENTTQTFYQLLNVSSLAEARQLNSSVIMRANALQIGRSPYGTYTYGPTVDGVFVPTQPGLALLNGQYAKDIKVMAGHNVNEGVLFSPSWLKSEADLVAWMTSMYPQGSRAVGDFILNNLYPPVYDGSHGYTSILTRVIRMVTEQVFTCNTNYMARASDNTTYNYEFQIPPALHGYDVPYTFYNGGSSVNPSIAATLQGWIARFAATGDPNGPGLPTFPMQGMNASMAGLNTTGVKIQPDDTANNRCRWWQMYLYM